MNINKAYFRFYEELNDFLTEEKRKTWIEYSFVHKVCVKDGIDFFGIPHTKIDLILRNSNPAQFSDYLKNNDRVSVYPVFESFDISNITHLRPKPLRESRFILDTDLDKLAQYLRMSGFNTLYRNDYTDEEIIDSAYKEKRIILTRRIELLKHKKVTRGLLIRSADPQKQMDEVIDALI